MGTKALTIVNDEQGMPIVCMYRQSDGGMCHAADLFEFLNSKEIVNGLPVGEVSWQGLANGMGCLAAQMVEHFKDGPGGIYLTSTECDWGHQYLYVVNWRREEGLWVSIYEHGRQIFDGPDGEFGEWLSTQGD